MNTTLLIMAAGIGSRFGTGIKQLEPVDSSRVYLKTQNCTKRQEKDTKGFYYRKYKEVIA